MRYTFVTHYPHISFWLSRVINLPPCRVQHCNECRVLSNRIIRNVYMPTAKFVDLELYREGSFALQIALQRTEWLDGEDNEKSSLWLQRWNYWLTDWLTDWLIDWMIDCLLDSLTDWMAASLSSTNHLSEIWNCTNLRTCKRKFVFKAKQRINSNRFKTKIHFKYIYRFTLCRALNTPP